MRSVFRLTIVVFLALMLVACSSGKPDLNANKNENIQLGLSLVDEKPSSYLSIEKLALGKEYLLHRMFSNQRSFGNHATNPMPESLRSMIVVFEEYGNEILMLDADKNIQPGEEYDPHILITSFPIVENNSEKIVFDFNRGMTTLLMTYEWFASDFYGRVIKADQPVSIRDSYITDMENRTNAVVIKQAANITQQAGVQPIEVTYYLTVYKKNESFVPVESPGFNYLGFFETNPLVQKDFGMPFSYISRWDISKPVTYYISRDFPEAYRDAVAEGVLYWNKVFNSEVMKVELAPEDFTAPDFEHNIIQWHTDHQGGYAYADAQMDPRTGEILHAQIFIPSSFTEWSMAYDVGKLDRKEGDKDALYLDAKELRESHLCELHLSDVTKNLFQYRDVIKTLTTAQMTEFTKNYLRQVVAHEVGHTLGLRHNFAGSTVSEWTGAMHDEVIKKYLTESVFPENSAPPTNSVMDYMTLDLDIFVGAMILRTDYGPFEYDKYAIDWAYYGGGSEPSYAGHPFCTDSHVETYDDCNRFDAGAHFIERSAYNVKKQYEDVPKMFAEYYLLSKAHMNPKFRAPVKESTPSASYLALQVLSEWGNLVSYLSDDLELRSFYFDYTDITEVELEKIDDQLEVWQNAEIMGAGGIDGIMKLIDPEYFVNIAANFAIQFEHLTGSDLFKDIPLYEGGYVSFSEDEVAYMRERAAEIFPRVEEEIVAGITEILKAADFKLIDSAEKLEAALARWADFVLTAGSGPEFRYGYETRQKAATLLTSTGPLPYWLKQYVPEIAERLRTKLESHFGKALEEIDLHSYARRDQEYVVNELSLYFMLAKSGGNLSSNVEQVAEGDGGEGEPKNSSLMWLRKILH